MIISPYLRAKMVYYLYKIYTFRYIISFIFKLSKKGVFFAVP